MIETLINFFWRLGEGKLMCSGFGEGHSAENVEKPCFSPKARDRARLSKLVATNSKPQAPCSLLQRLNPSAKPAPAWPRRPVLAYIKELHWLTSELASSRSCQSTAALRCWREGREGRQTHISERGLDFTALLRGSSLAHVTAVL